MLRIIPNFSNRTKGVFGVERNPKAVEPLHFCNPFLTQVNGLKYLIRNEPLPSSILIIYESTLKLYYLIEK